MNVYASDKARCKCECVNSIKHISNNERIALVYLPESYVPMFPVPYLNPTENLLDDLDQWVCKMPVS